MFKDHSGDKHFLVHGLYVWKIWIFSPKIVQIVHILTVDGTYLTELLTGKEGQIKLSPVATFNPLSRCTLWGLVFNNTGQL